ncbi:hypothetical protein ACFRFU_47535 [Streptomyces sp. NPDC056704]|uniref:hypothetical protein n=1 Tax=Streptomyces TaxID=1883 RepID=UPI00367DDFE2
MHTTQCVVAAARLTDPGDGWPAAEYRPVGRRVIDLTLGEPARSMWITRGAKTNSARADLGSMWAFPGV